MRIPNKNIILCLILIIPFIGKTQYSNSNGLYVNDNVENEIHNNLKSVDYKKNNVYFELLGNGLGYSLGYERLFFLKHKHILFINSGLTYWIDENVISSQIGYLYGDKHKFELGLGYTVSFWHSKYHEKNVYNNWIIGRIGYRYQKNADGLFFKAGILYLKSIYIGSDIDMTGPWGGIGIGYIF